MPAPSKKELAKKAVEEYTGEKVVEIEVHQDPKVAGCIAFRTKSKKGGEWQCWLKTHNDPITAETIEEAEFDEFPPKSGELKHRQEKKEMTMEKECTQCGTMFETDSDCEDFCSMACMDAWFCETQPSMDMLDDAEFEDLELEDIDFDDDELLDDEDDIDESLGGLGIVHRF